MNVSTLIIYVTYGILSVSSAYVAQRNKNKWLAFLSYLICVFFWGLRKDIGFDYEGYVEIFFDIKYGGKSYVEFGYLYLNKLFAFSQEGYIYVLLIASAITFAFLFITFWKRHILWQGLFFSLVFQFQFMAANQVRQAMAIAIFLYLLQLVEEKKYIKYGIGVICTALLIHYSAIVLFLAIPVSRIRLNKKYAAIILLVVYYLYLTGTFTKVGSYMLSVLPIPDKYQFYLTSQWVNSENVGFSLVQLFNVVIGLYLIWNVKFNDSRIVSVFYFGLLMYMIFIEYHLFLRMSAYFLYANILAAAIFIKNKPRKSELLMIFCAIYYILICSQSGNMHGVIPYQSIIE